MRVPDVTLGANWDRAGSYIYNYNSVSLSLPLPLLNRNTGNIKIARDQVEQSKVQLMEAAAQVKIDLSTALSQLLENERLYEQVSGQFNSDYEKLVDGITMAYQKHTISLLEFIDYYETYKNSRTEFYRLQKNRLIAVENLNLATGTNILKP